MNDYDALLLNLTAIGPADVTVPNVPIDLRDRAFTYLKLAIDKIRECGRFVFWRNPDRLKGYTSDYWKQQKKSATEKV
jgi:hypothetical protein